jgi:hypothetical protein
LPGLSRAWKEANSLLLDYYLHNSAFITIPGAGDKSKRQNKKPPFSKSLGMSIVSLIIGLGLFPLVFLGMSFGEVIPRTGVVVVPHVIACNHRSNNSPYSSFGNDVAGNVYPIDNC